MATIEAIKIRGFQSHTASYFNLGQGLTVITGPSDIGKTAVIRAVRWVAFGEPKGEAFVNEAVGEAEVILYLDNGVIIRKHRRKGKTSYTIQADGNDEGTTFEKNEVPAEVTAALGLEKQTFGDFETALNFAFQLDSPFLISETASAGAKILGKLAGTETVDLAIKDVSKDTYAARQEKAVAQKEVERVEMQLGEFIDLDQLKQQLEACEYLVEQIDKDAARLDRMKDQAKRYKIAQATIEEVGQKLEALAIVPDLEADLKEIEKAQQRYDKLLGLYGQYSKVVESLAGLNEKLDALGSVEAITTLVNDVETNYQRAASLINLSRSYQKYAEEVNKAAGVLEATLFVDRREQELKQIEADAKRASDLSLLKARYAADTVLVNDWQFEIDCLAGVGEATELLEGVGLNQVRIDQLKQLLERYEVYKGAVDITINRVYHYTRAFEQAEAELKAAWEATGGICPLCDRPHEGVGC